MKHSAPALIKGPSRSFADRPHMMLFTPLDRKARIVSVPKRPFSFEVMYWSMNIMSQSSAFGCEFSPVGAFCIPHDGLAWEQRRNESGKEYVSMKEGESEYYVCLPTGACIIVIQRGACSFLFCVDKGYRCVFGVWTQRRFHRSRTDSLWKTNEPDVPVPADR